MKKILIIALLALVSVISVNAINIQKNTISKVWTEFVGDYRFMYDASDSTYFFSLKTSNRFDDRMIIIFGTKEEAIQNCKDILDNWDGFENNDKFNVGESRFTIQKSMGSKVMFIEQNGYAGYAYLEYGKIKKSYEKLTNTKYQKPNNK